MFPRLGLKVAPVAGSLIGWQTIGSKGQVLGRLCSPKRIIFWKVSNGLQPPYKVLEESLHLGCPVVHGEKWVFNKWVIH